MKEKIIENIKNIKELENLYRSDPAQFTAAFNDIYTSLSEEPLARFWFTRLNYSDEKTIVNEISQPEKKSSFLLWFTVAASLAAGTIAKLPVWFQPGNNHSWINSSPFVVFPLLSVYFIHKNKTSKRKNIVMFAVVVISAIFLNLLPTGYESHTHYLSALHLFLFMWVIWGLTYIGFDFHNTAKKLDFYKRNGDLMILTAIILCGGGLLTGLTFGLFSTIQIRIEEFYFKYVVIYGLSASPFVANYMLENNPLIVNKVAPYIAKIFTPLVLITMTCFLVALIFFANDPFNNRNELMAYNVLLIVILAIIVFGFPGRKSGSAVFFNIILIMLLLEAMIINSVALSAIIYRISEFGFSPNRTAVIGGNLLMFINIAVIAYQLIRHIKNPANESGLEQSVTFMLPVYAAWVMFVSFVFPFIFWFS